MFQNNLFADGQTEAGSIGFIVCDEGLEQLGTNLFRDARSIVDEADLQPTGGEAGFDDDGALVFERFR